MAETIAFDKLKAEMIGRVMFPTMLLRFVGQTDTTTLPRILQQAWQNMSTGEIEWKTVPLVLLDAAEYQAATAPHA